MHTCFVTIPLIKNGRKVNKYLTLIICSFLFAGPVSAEMSAEKKAEQDRDMAIMMRAGTLLNEAVTRAMEQCGTTQFAVSLPQYSYAKQAEVTYEANVSIDEWSGGCADGKRDGDGVLSWHTEDRLGITEVKHKITITAEGRFVKGKRLGMWCVTKLQSALDDKPSSRAPLTGIGCSIKDSYDAPFGLYIKQPDGRWQEYVQGAPKAMFLAAGELEALSSKLLTDAAAGKTDLKAQVVVQSRDLDDLVRGSKITLGLSAVPPSLKDKRVAIVLSSKMVSELERFKRERQALIDASAGLRGEAAEERNKFIHASNPDRLLTTIFKVLKKHIKDVQPADDLAGLKEGGFDYALVMDWQSMTRFDQLGKYSKEAWPLIPYPTTSGVVCESLGGFLISRDLKAIRKMPGIPNCQQNHFPTTGDHGYMQILAAHFTNSWGDGQGNFGNGVILSLNSFLEYPEKVKSQASK